MTVRMVLVNSVTERDDETKRFYEDLFGFERQGDVWLSAKDAPPVWLAVWPTGDGDTGRVFLTFSVDDPDPIYAVAVSRGDRIVEELATRDHADGEVSYQVRRFMVEDPSGLVVNVMRHA